MKLEDKKYTLIPIVLIIFFGLISYSNSLNGEFVWDDNFLVRDNAYIKNWSDLPKFFTESMGAGCNQPKKYSFYRPIQMITYTFDYSLWKLDVRGYHLTNIFLHIGAALSLFWLISVLYNDWRLSLLTGLFWIVHPIHTESVSYISGRAEPLALMFMLLCFVFFVKAMSHDKKIYHILIPVSFILALLSKEMSIILPVLLVLYCYAFCKRIKLKFYVPILIILALYCISRVTILSFLFTKKPVTTTLLQRFGGFCAALTNYFRIMILPFDLHMEYCRSSLTIPKIWVGGLIIIILLGLVLKSRSTRNIVFFSITWFFITLLPSSNLYPINAYMAEHWLYLPSIGAFLILSKGLLILFENQKLKSFAIVLTLSLLGFYSALTFAQNDYWREPLTFYERTVKYSPNSSRVNYNLGLLYKEMGRKEEAVASYKKAIKARPDYALAHYNLANLYLNMDHKEKAIAAYEQAVEINPEYVEAYNNLGFAYSAVNRYEDSIASYKRSIAINSSRANTHNNLGLVYADVNRKEEAIASFKRAIELKPDYVKAHYNLGNVYLDLGRNEDAVFSYKQAVRFDPDYAPARNKLTIIHSEQK